MLQNNALSQCMNEVLWQINLYIVLEETSCSLRVPTPPQLYLKPIHHLLYARGTQRVITNLITNLMTLHVLKSRSD